VFIAYVVLRIGLFDLCFVVFVFLCSTGYAGYMYYCYYPCSSAGFLTTLRMAGDQLLLEIGVRLGIIRSSAVLRRPTPDHGQTLKAKTEIYAMVLRP